MTHAIHINGSDTPTVVQPESHTWRPRNTLLWEVRISGTNMVVERNAPPRPVRPKPITPFAGSWADDMQRKREGR